MASIERFEDIEAWKDARTLVNLIYTVTENRRFANGFALRDQIRRAAISVMSNIAEGFERETDKEFIRFLYIAKASAGEVRSQVYVALDLGYLNKQESDDILALLQTTSRRISGFIRYLCNTDQPQRKTTDRHTQKHAAANFDL